MKKEKAMYGAKIKKEKQTCEAKNNLKRKLKNDEEEFNIDGDIVMTDNIMSDSHLGENIN